MGSLYASRQASHGMQLTSTPWLP